MYKNGEGVEKNFEKAVQCYKKAVALGHSDAMNNLGVMYENGEGVERNVYKAYQLYKKAAQIGNDLAMSNLEKLRKKVSVTKNKKSRL